MTRPWCIDNGKDLRDNLTVWARPGIAVAPRTDLSRYFQETTACKNEVFLFRKQLDVKMTSCTFTTRYRAYRLYSGTGSFQRSQGESSFKVSSLPFRVASTSTLWTM